MTIIVDIMDLICFLMLGAMFVIAAVLYIVCIVCGIATLLESRGDKHDSETSD